VRRRFQKNKLHPPGLAVGNNTSTRSQAFCLALRVLYLHTTFARWNTDSTGNAKHSGDSMANQAQEEAYLILVDRYIVELEGRINALRERILTMVAEGQDTKNQSELLFDMLKALEAVKEVESRALIRLTAYDNYLRLRLQAA
jgi:hypothetical protein